jgi:hypothetical protein
LLERIIMYSEEDISLILKILKNKLETESIVSENYLLDIVKGYLPDYRRGTFVGFLKNNRYIYSTDGGRNTRITKKGLKLIRKIDRNARLNNFNVWASFLKNIIWLIAFIFSLLFNIIFILKYFDVF